jgi:hypothetical protein
MAPATTPGAPVNLWLVTTPTNDRTCLRPLIVSALSIGRWTPCVAIAISTPACSRTTRA